MLERVLEALTALRWRENLNVMWV